MEMYFYKGYFDCQTLQIYTSYDSVCPRPTRSIGINRVLLQSLKSVLPPARGIQIYGTKPESLWNSS